MIHTPKTANVFFISEKWADMILVIWRRYKAQTMMLVPDFHLHGGYE
jgi:hypothetical protein